MIAAMMMTWVLAAVTVLAAWTYSRQWALNRPPLGTVNLGDVGFTLGCIVALPFLYLWLPGWAAGGLLAITTLSAIWFVVEPLTSSSLARWGVAGGLVAADAVLAWRVGTSATAFLMVNDAVIVLVAIGVSVLWAQGGFRARDMAILAGAITVYDLVTTGFLPLTTELIERLAGMPYMPLAAWPAGNGEWAGIGLGDLLMAAVGPVVLRKAYGTREGLVAVAIALATIGLVLAVARWDALPATFPTMVVLGPLLVAQYLVAQRRHGGERTTAQYLAQESLPAVAAAQSGPVLAAIGERRAA